MSVALFISLIYFGLLLFYPCISTELNPASYSVLGITLRFLEDDMIVAIIAGAIVLLALIALILAFLKKFKPSGIFMLLSCLVLFVSYALLPSMLDDGELISSYSLSSVVNPSFIFISVLAFAFSVFIIKNPDASIGNKSSVPALGGMVSPAPRNAYPQVNAAPVRQNMYSAPVQQSAPVAPPAPAPAPAAPMPAAAPASSGGTYTCPVCGTTQKSDLAFCTFCGNANPNK